MARSTYIYVVCVNGFLESAFTVKHEMISSLPNNSNILENYEILRIKDNDYAKEKPLDITEDIIREYYDK